MILPCVWRDGALCAAEQAVVPASDRTLLYGLGAFETFRLHGGRPFLYERHLQRLRRSLAALELPVPSVVDQLGTDLPRLAERNGVASALCRVTVTAGPDTGRSTDPSGMHVFAMLRPVPPPPSRGSVRVDLAQATADVHSPLAGVKSTSYLVNYLLREAAERAGRLDDLMVDKEGAITEATVSSVFFVRDGRLETPPLSAGVLAGVTRGLVLELAEQLDLAHGEARWSASELGRADECFLTGAGKILASVDALAGRPMSAERPVTERLRAALVQRIAAECDVPEASVSF